MLCIQFFEGKGYSAEFVDNMLQIKEKLENDNPMVKIVIGADSICMKCPNLINGKCKSEEEILEHDKRVYHQINKTFSAKSYDRRENYFIEKEMRWKDICNVVYNEIINKNKLKDVCVKCKWSDICYNKK
jgi:hypothetical protein